MNPERIIQQLDMQPHPEGGYYKETYRAAEVINTADGRKRNVSTAIYYMLTGGDKSHLHRLKSDEAWFFHQGETLEIVIIEDGILRSVLLGNAIENGEVPQVTIPAGAWFGARLKAGKGYALVSCTVAPGFVFEDFEMGRKEDFASMNIDWKEIKELVL
jgi:predicted cupin superfamily sugar epimerase